MTTVTKEMAEAALKRVGARLTNAYSGRSIDTAFIESMRADGADMKILRTRLTALEAENAALREQVKALKGGV